MAASPRTRNPFYVLLVLVGVVFFVTATAYGVMTVRHLHAQPLPDETVAAGPLLQFLDEHGFVVLMSELVVLGLATVAAIGTDEYWSRRASRHSNQGTDTEDRSPS